MTALKLYDRPTSLLYFIITCYLYCGIRSDYYELSVSDIHVYIYTLAHMKMDNLNHQNKDRLGDRLSPWCANILPSRILSQQRYLFDLRFGILPEGYLFVT